MRKLTSLLFVLAMLTSSSAFARNGSIYLELAPAWGFFSADEVIIEKGNDPGPTSPPGGFVPQLKVGLNLFGYAGVESDIAALGWDVTNSKRGGTGWVGGVFRITPLELLRWVIPETVKMPSLIPKGPVSWHDRPFDLGLYVGGGYTLIGEDYGYQGKYLKWGADLKFFITPNFALGIDLPVRNMFYEPFRYTNYGDSLGVCTDGADVYTRGGIPLPTHDLAVIGSFNASEMGTVCTSGRPPKAWLFSPALTISGVLDFGI